MRAFVFWGHSATACTSRCLPGPLAKGRHTVARSLERVRDRWRYLSIVRSRTRAEGWLDLLHGLARLCSAQELQLDGIVSGAELSPELREVVQTSER